MSDNLSDIIALAKRELPDVPPEVWARFERLIRANYGAQRIYVQSHKKRARLEQIAAAGDQADATTISRMLGISVRRVQQLQKLK